MKLSGPIIAAVLLAALSGILYWSNHHKPEEGSAVNASLNSSPKILSFNQADIVKVKIQRKGQNQVDLTKDDSGSWQISGPAPLAADQAAVSSLLASLSALDSDRLVEDNVKDFSPYGLANPSLELDVTLKNGKSEKLLIGDRTPAGNDYYAMLTGDPRLFILASFNESSLDKNENDLRDKRLITLDFDKVSRIELLDQQSGKKSAIAFERVKDTWQIMRPMPYRTDGFRVDELVSTLKNARFIPSANADEKKDSAAFQSAQPFAAATVIGATGTQRVEIRKLKGDFFAKSSVVSGVHKVSEDIGTGLNKSLDDFRNKKLFDFGYTDPDNIELHDGDKSYYLTRSGSDWWGPDGQKLDKTTTDTLLDRLRDLSASKFTDSGFTEATLRISVLSNDKKHSEALLLAKTKDNYIAKRVGEPALYEVPNSAVEDLRAAAANLKPAPAPASKK